MNSAVEYLLDESQLVAWGERIGKEATAPLVLALHGDLGAGKTTLARAVVRGAGLDGPVPSPTYNLLFRYPSPRGVELVHVDLYRLEGADEVWALGWSELPRDDEIVLIEWPQRAGDLLPTPRWEIQIEESESPERRRVRVIPMGSPGPIPRPEV